MRDKHVRSRSAYMVYTCMSDIYHIWYISRVHVYVIQVYMVHIAYTCICHTIYIVYALYVSYRCTLYAPYVHHIYLYDIYNASYTCICHTGIYGAYSVYMYMSYSLYRLCIVYVIHNIWCTKIYGGI